MLFDIGKPFLRLGMVILALASTWGITGCSGEPSAVEDKTLRIAVTTEPPTLDWSLATDGVSFNVLTNIMEGLTQYNDQLEPIPAIAETLGIFRKRARDHFLSARRCEVDRRPAGHRPAIRVLLETPAQSRYRRPIRLLPVRYRKRRRVQLRKNQKCRASGREGSFSD